MAGYWIRTMGYTFKQIRESFVQYPVIVPKELYMRATIHYQTNPKMVLTDRENYRQYLIHEWVDKRYYWASTFWTR